MAFQDAWTLDLDRLRHCYLHVLAADGRVVPFCSYNLTAVDGGGLPAGRRASSAAGAPPCDADEPSYDAGAPPRDAGGRVRRRSGCMVCGAELVYREVERSETCHYCGAVRPAAARCAAGHFVCDACHRAAAVEALERICLRSREPDALALMEAVRSHPAFPMHGPEHHSLVPAVILTALRNDGAPVTEEQIVAAIRRGETVTGGACAYLGVCGAASGVGIAASLLLGADPLDGRARQAGQRAVARVLEAVAAYDEAPRCCQRDAWTAIREATVLLPALTGLTLRSSHDLVCRQWRANAECIRESCPLWPAGPAEERSRTGAGIPARRDAQPVAEW